MNIPDMSTSLDFLSHRLNSFVSDFDTKISSFFKYDFKLVSDQLISHSLHTLFLYNERILVTEDTIHSLYAPINDRLYNAFKRLSLIKALFDNFIALVCDSYNYPLAFDQYELLNLAIMKLRKEVNSNG